MQTLWAWLVSRLQALDLLNLAEVPAAAQEDADLELYSCTSSGLA